MVRIGLIGLGVHGARYASHLLRGEVRGARLIAICRRDHGAGAEFAAAHGLKYYDDLRALAADPDLDAVAVVVPSPVHLQACVAALRAGKAVLVEKPLVTSMDQGRELERECRSAGVPLMVAQTFRYNTVVEALRRLRESLGRPIRLRMALRLPPERLYWESEGTSRPRGSLLETGVHLFDAARWILDDEPEEVVCLTARLLSDSAEDFFSAELVMTRTGARCQVEVTKCTRTRVEPVDLTCESGVAAGDARANELAVVREGQRRRVELGPAAFTVARVLEDFVSCVAGRSAVPVTLEDGLRAVQVALACRASAERRTPVRVPPDVWGACEWEGQGPRQPHSES